MTPLPVRSSQSSVICSWYFCSSLCRMLSYDPRSCPSTPWVWESSNRTPCVTHSPFKIDFAKPIYTSVRNVQIHYIIHVRTLDICPDLPHQTALYGACSSAVVTPGHQQPSVPVNGGPLSSFGLNNWCVRCKWWIEFSGFGCNSKRFQSKSSYYVCIAVAASAVVTQAADKRQLMQHHQDIPLSHTPGPAGGNRWTVIADNVLAKNAPLLSNGMALIFNTSFPATNY